LIDFKSNFWDAIAMEKITIPKHGGARPGAGRKPNDHISRGAELEFSEARARNESAKASLNQHRLMVAQGEYLPREAIRQAAAMAVAALRQAIASIPDNLERSCALTPAQADIAQRMVDAALTEASNAFKALAEGCGGASADGRPEGAND
jgi:hypothetical protein